MGSTYVRLENLHEEFATKEILLPLCKALSQSDDYFVAERILTCFNNISANSMSIEKPKHLAIQLSSLFQEITRANMGIKEVVRPLMKFIETVPTEEFETCFLCSLSTIVSLSVDGKFRINVHLFFFFFSPFLVLNSD